MDNADHILHVGPIAPTPAPVAVVVPVATSSNQHDDNEEESWQALFESCGFDNETVDLYCGLMAENDFTIDLIDEVDRALLKEMGVTSVGHQVKIMKEINNRK